jgi:hypothetical protein
MLWVAKDIALLRKLWHRGLLKVGLVFTFAAAAKCVNSTQIGRLYVQRGSIQQILIAERLGEEFPCPSLRARSVPCGARSVRSNHGYPDVIRLERITGYCQRWPLYGRLALYQKPTDNLEGM